MPRIPNAYLDCVVYLYKSEEDAKAGKRAGGSGFLVGIMSEGLGTEMMFLHVVTNKHIAQRFNVIRMNTKDGKKTIVTDPSTWMFHPEGDDLAACIISFDPNEFRFKYVERHIFLTQQMVDEYQIGPGDDVFMVGRFVNHEGTQLNLPSVRFGNIAQMPIEPIQQENGFMQESFLVEIRSVGGYSGSPVFVHIPVFSDRPIINWAPTTIRTQEKANFGFLKSHGPWLLGVDWGHLHDWASICDENGRPLNSDPKTAQVKLNTGMSTVVPAWKLAKVLDEGKLADHRKSVVDQILAERSLNAYNQEPHPDV